MALRLADLADARVAIWGFGSEGRSALAALRRRFPDKPLTVFCSDEEARNLAAGDTSMRAAPSIASDNPAESGAQPSALSPQSTTLITAPPGVAALEAFDIVIKSPGISPYKLPAAAALRAGVRFSSGSALWFAEHPHARTICVTGTKGKSTVTALVAHVLRRAGERVGLAGNVGLPLLDLIAPATAPSWWAIELSSFQTHDFAGAPSVAVVNNLYEEHLDWHGTFERYATDKLAIGAAAERLVVNAQASLLERTTTHRCRSVFGTADGWHVAGDAIRRGAMTVLPLNDLPLPGAHNALNVCAALAAIEAAGFDGIAFARHVATFEPLPHRLQRLGRSDGIEYVNDSIATTPHATIEALRSIGGRPLAVLVGGFDRGVDWRPFVDHVTAHPPAAVVTMGANGAAIAAVLKAVAAPGFALNETASLADAVAQARAAVAPHGTVLLSPGAPSFDAFGNYAERGREFARLAGFDPEAIAQIGGLGIA